MPTQFTVRLLRAALAVTALLAAATPVAAQPAAAPGKFDTVVADRARQLTGRSRVLVEFHDRTDVRAFGKGTAGRRISDRLQVAEVENRALAAVAADPRVRRIMVDRALVPTLERTGAAIGAVIARQTFGLSGRGIGVAVVDSGVTAYHDDLYRTRSAARERPEFKDFTLDPLSNIVASESAWDDYGHGTHVSGAIAGNGFDSSGARTGVAPAVRIVGLKVLDAEGHGYISNVIAAIDYAIAMRSTYNIRIINLSVASGVFESYSRDPLALAARRAVDAGIVVIAAAGNLGEDEQGRTQFGGITSPGNAPWVLTVGASSHNGTPHRSDDTIAAFSSRGPSWIDFAAKPDLLAPGVGIESLSDPASRLYATLPDYLLDGTRQTRYKPYLSLSGTSMAAPIVAGTVALMLEANPALTPNAVKAILHYTAQVHGAAGPLAQGAGMLNAAGAVRLARFFADPERGVGPMSDVIAGETIPWSQHLLWGNYLVSGGLPLPGSNAWLPGVTWGDLKTPAGAAIVWGADDDSNIVWSTDDDGNIVWSTEDDGNIVWSTGDEDGNIVWSTDDAGNIVWSTEDDSSIVWSTALARNVVWANDCGGHNCRRVVWGARYAGGVWGTADEDSNIVWSTDDDGNIVWSTDDDGNIVWSTDDDGNIVWSTNDEDGNIVWSTGAADHVVWPAAAK